MRHLYRILVAISATIVPLVPAHAQIVESPNCTGTQPPTASLQGATTHIYRNVGDRELRLHVFSPGATDTIRRPAIAFFFGGGFVAGDVAIYAKLARAYAAKGYVAILPDYRVYCRDHTSPAEAVDDGRAALQWIRTHSEELGIDRRRIVLGGSSAGGFIAASVAQGHSGNPPVAALVLLNPALDLTFRGRIPNLDAAIARQISPLHMSYRHLPPTVAFHGDADAIVPIQQSRDHCAAAKAAGRICELIEYPGRGHTLHIDTSIAPGRGIRVTDDVFARSIDFLGAALKLKPR